MSELEPTLSSAHREPADSHAALAECRAQLTQTKAELDGLLYAISHDLRAPMRAITGFSRALQEDCAELMNAETQHHLQRIIESTQKLNDMLDGLLALSRLSSVEFERMSLDLSALAREATQQVARLYPQHNPELHIAEGLLCEGDPRALRQTLQHLFDNSFRCTAGKPGALIEFGIDESAQEPGVYFVRDNGVGFDMNQAHKLFIPFQRLHARSDLCGAGLGLACAQRIVSRHGGRIWADSAAGQGATFRFTLG